MYPELKDLFQTLRLGGSEDEYVFEEDSLFQTCCIMPELTSKVDIMIEEIQDEDELDEDAIALYFTHLAVLVMHYLCPILDASEKFEESSSLRSIFVTSIRHQEDLLEGTLIPSVTSLMRYSESLYDSCEDLESSELGSEDSLGFCIQAVASIGMILESFECTSLVDRVLKWLESM